LPESNFIEFERPSYPGSFHLFSCWRGVLLVKSERFRILPAQYFGGTMKQALNTLAGVLTLSIAIGCAGGSLTTREKGAGIGALGGAAAGGIIGATVGHPGAGAAIGGALGLGAGALVGDQLQGQEIKQGDQQRQMDANQAEIERQRREIERLRKQGEY
jgi:hypothetical protein